MKRMLVRLVWPIVIAVLVVAVYSYGKTRPVAVETAPVRRGRIEEHVTEEARTQLHTERVVTADAQGTSARITLEEGDSVRAGQQLTTIEDTELKLSLEVLRSNVAEAEARLAGADVPLPKQSEIEAAERERQRALEQLETLKQEKKAAEADLKFAEKESRRIKDLFDSGSATDRQHDAAQRDLAVARAGLDALTHRLAAAQTAVEISSLRKQVLLDSMQDTAHMHRVYEAQMGQYHRMIDLIGHRISKTKVTSPIAGVILEKYVDSDQYVQPGTPLVKVGDMGSIEIRADILSDEVGRVRVGQQVILVGKAIGKAGATGRVSKIYPSGFTKMSSLGVRQQRVAVLIGFDSSELDLQPGYELDVRIVVAARDDAVLVPSEAVFATAEGEALFVVQDGRARLRPISTGLKGDEFYAVTEGLEPGDVAILHPPRDLEDRRRVAVPEG